MIKKIWEKKYENETFKRKKKDDTEKKEIIPNVPYILSYLARDILTHFLSRNSFTPFFSFFHFFFLYYHRVIIRVFFFYYVFFLLNSDEMKISSALNFL